MFHFRVKSAYHFIFLNKFNTNTVTTGAFYLLLIKSPSSTKMEESLPNLRFTPSIQLWVDLGLIHYRWRLFDLLLTHLLEKAMAPHSSILAWKIPRTEEPGRLQSMGSLRVGHDWANSLSLFTFHFHELEKEMETHSGILAWRIPGMAEPGGLPSMGSHRVRHD